MEISFHMAKTTEALCPPLMILTTKKSPMTSAMTKIEPSAMPVFDQRNHDLGDHPPAAGAGIDGGLDDAGSIRAMELNRVTIMNSVKRCT